VPKHVHEQEIERLLGYSDSPEPGTFVVEVMNRVKREQRTRKLILWAFGLIGAMFGLAGAAMLSDSIADLFTFTVTMPATQTAQVVLFIVAAVAFYTWFMNDDLALGG
jgi:hypothetical protein